MSIKLVIESKDLEKAIAALNRIANPDIGDLLTNIGSEAEAQTRIRLTEEKKSPDGVPWKDLLPEYEEWKAQHHPVPNILIFEGDMRDSIQFQVTGEEAEVGSTMKYAKYHQTPRPFLGLSDDNEESIKELTTDWLREVAGL